MPKHWGVIPGEPETAPNNGRRSTRDMAVGDSYDELVVDLDGQQRMIRKQVVRRTVEPNGLVVVVSREG